MRIAIDARELEGKPTGVGRYLSNLLSRWLSSVGDDTFVLYHRGDLQRQDWMESERLFTRRLEGGLLPLGVWWQQVVLQKALRTDRPDILFAPADSMPLRWRGPSLVTFHDLSYEAHPEWFDRSEGWRRRALARRSARRAGALVAISNFTKDELVSRFRIPEEKVSVVHHGIDDSLQRVAFTPEDELRRRLGMTRPFAIVVGSIFERRFPLQIIRSFRLLGDLDIGIVFAGEDRRRERGGLQSQIDEAGLADRIRWLDYCSEEDLCGLYRSASMLISLSLYEGFSLPPLEAMSFGLPVIVSARGAQLEVYGSAALTVAEETEENIAAAVRSVLCDAAIRDRLVTGGRELVSRLTLERCASRTLELIRQTAGAGGE